jgi:ATP-dependent DNA helicase DinG
VTLAVDEVLGADGLVARRLPGWELRPEQLELARAIERALAERGSLLAEAGTGVGKSFAYLAPAAAHACAHAGDGPVVISTRTIALQQQLEHKDVPFLQQILPLEWSAVTAVGRGNYLCLRRMHLAHSERRSLFRDAEHEAQVARVVEWSVGTRDGTRMAVPFALDERVWDEVRAEHGNCLNRACRHYEPCHWQRARRRMDGAQVLIVNHALYFADVALRMAGARYLPAHRVVVFDEAHHLERTATEALGLRLARTTVHWHLRRLHAREDRSLLLRCGAQAAAGMVHDLRAQTDAFFAGLDERLAAGDGQVALGDEPLDASLGDAFGALAGVLEEACTQIEALDLKMELLARAHALAGLSAPRCTRWPGARCPAWCAGWRARATGRRCVRPRCRCAQRCATTCSAPR